MIRFSAKYLKALLPFKSNGGDPRYYLNSIHIAPHEDGGAVLVATNGHTMMCIRDIAATCDAPTTITVRDEAASHCNKRGREPEPMVHVNTITQRLHITGGEGNEERYLQPGKCLLELTGPAYPGGYVDWRAILPDFTQLKLGAVDAIQAHYYEMAARAHPMHRRSSGMGRPAGMRFWQTCEYQVLAVEFCGAPEYLLLIMPIRADAADAVASKWANSFKRKGPAAPAVAAPTAEPEPQVELKQPAEVAA